MLPCIYSIKYTPNKRWYIFLYIYSCAVKGMILRKALWSEVSCKWVQYLAMEGWKTCIWSITNWNSSFQSIYVSRKCHLFLWKLSSVMLMQRRRDSVKIAVKWYNVNMKNYCEREKYWINGGVYVSLTLMRSSGQQKPW